MQCVQSLGPITADIVPLTPMRSGDCGTPAPVLVRSIGSKFKVTFDPPLILNCPMVVALIAGSKKTFSRRRTRSLVRQSPSFRSSQEGGPNRRLCIVGKPPNIISQTSHSLP